MLKILALDLSDTAYSDSCQWFSSVNRQFLVLQKFQSLKFGQFWPKLGQKMSFDDYRTFALLDLSDVTYFDCCQWIISTDGQFLALSKLQASYLNLGLQTCYDITSYVSPGVEHVPYIYYLQRGVKTAINTPYTCVLTPAREIKIPSSPNHMSENSDFWLFISSFENPHHFQHSLQKPFRSENDKLL